MIEVAVQGVQNRSADIQPVSIAGFCGLKHSCMQVIKPHSGKRRV